MVHAPRHGSSGKRDGLPRAIHLRISEVEACQLEAYAKRMAGERRSKVTVSEAARDLMSKGLNQEVKPWEAALKSLPFVAWQGGKPAIPQPKEHEREKALSAVVLEDRDDRL